MPYLPFVAGTDPLGNKRANGERDVEREKDKGLLETRGEGNGGKTPAVDPSHSDVLLVQMPMVATWPISSGTASRMIWPTCSRQLIAVLSIKPFR